MTKDSTLMGVLKQILDRTRKNNLVFFEKVIPITLITTDIKINGISKIRSDANYS